MVNTGELERLPTRVINHIPQPSKCLLLTLNRLAAMSDLKAFAIKS